MSEDIECITQGLASDYSSFSAPSKLTTTPSRCVMICMYLDSNTCDVLVETRSHCIKPEKYKTKISVVCRHSSDGHMVSRNCHNTIKEGYHVFPYLKHEYKRVVLDVLSALT